MGCVLTLAAALLSSASCKRPGPVAAPLTATALPDDVVALIAIGRRDGTLAAGEACQRRALAALHKAHTLDPTSVEAAWRGAQVAGYLVEQLPAERKTERKAIAEQGLALGEAAVKLAPDAVETRYYLGVVLGRLAELGTTKSFDLVKRLAAEARLAIRLDRRFDHGGPLRLLGAALLKAPPPPSSIGDPEEGLLLIEQAVAIDPSYVLNRLFLGEAYYHNECYRKAALELLGVIASPLDGDWRVYAPRWRKEAESYRRKAQARLRETQPGIGL